MIADEEELLEEVIALRVIPGMWEMESEEI